MKRLLTALALGAALLWPAAASGATTSWVWVNMGVVTYAAADATSESMTLSDGSGTNAGSFVVGRAVYDPYTYVGTGCTGLTYTSAVCGHPGIVSASFTLKDLDDTFASTTALPVTVDGGTGADKLDGGAGADTIIGGDGADVLDGRGGQDAIQGGADADTIFAADGLPDTVDCGSGTDTVSVDPSDTLTKCEVVGTGVVQPAPEAEPPTSPPVSDPVTSDPVVEPKAPAGESGKPAPSAPKGDPKAPAKAGDDDEPLVALPLPFEGPVGVTHPVATVSADGRAALEMACAPTEANGCRGEVFLDPAPAATALKARKGKVRLKVTAYLARRGRYGKSPFVIAAGKKAKLQVRLTPAARKALGLRSAGKARAARRGRRVRARVTVVQKGKKAVARSVVELRG